jgi:ketosteroid isomerase-like protein
MVSRPFDLADMCYSADRDGCHLEPVPTLGRSVALAAALSAQRGRGHPVPNTTGADVTTTIATDFSARLFDASDAFDLDRYIDFLAPDVRFQFGNAAPIHGRDDVREAVGAFFGTIAGIEHDILVEWFPEENVSVQKLSVTYTRQDGDTVVLPAVNILQVHDDLITDYQIHVDLTPVYA